MYDGDFAAGMFAGFILTLISCFVISILFWSPGFSLARVDYGRQYCKPVCPGEYRVEYLQGAPEKPWGCSCINPVK